MKRLLFVTTLCTLLLAGYGCSSTQANDAPKDLTQYVDPYIGSGGHPDILIRASFFMRLTGR